MFTGIIQTVGTVGGVQSRGAGARLRIRAARAKLGRVRMGDSIAVNGCCLTVAKLRADGFTADLTAETLARTSLGRLAKGDRVNLEGALRAGDPLGGHIVQGHVEATGTLLDLKPVPGGGGWWLRVRVPKALLRYTVWKGALTVEGISLTIARLSGATAGFAIVPHTYANTHLATLEPGTKVNVETDPIARYVERLLAAGASSGRARGAG